MRAILTLTTVLVLATYSHLFFDAAIFQGSNLSNLLSTPLAKVIRLLQRIQNQRNPAKGTTNNSANSDKYPRQDGRVRFGLRTNVRLGTLWAHHHVNRASTKQSLGTWQVGGALWDLRGRFWFVHECCVIDDRHSNSRFLWRRSRDVSIASLCHLSCCSTVRYIVVLVNLLLCMHAVLLFLDILTLSLGARIFFARGRTDAFGSTPLSSCCRVASEAPQRERRVKEI
jgi:hypothetical protein